MLGWPRRRRRSRRHPTPEEAYERLASGLCLYAGLTKCQEQLKQVGLRHDLDENVVLVCKAHFGRLRRMDERRLDELERYLRNAFAWSPVR